MKEHSFFFPCYCLFTRYLCSIPARVVWKLKENLVKTQVHWNKIALSGIIQPHFVSYLVSSWEQDVSCRSNLHRLRPAGQIPLWAAQLPTSAHGRPSAQKNSCAKGKQPKNLASFFPLHALRYLKMSNSVEWTRFHLSSSWKGKSERPLINSQWTTPKKPKKYILDIYFLTLKIFETYIIALRPSMNSSLDLLYLAGHIGRCSIDIWTKLKIQTPSFATPCINFPKLF